MNQKINIDAECQFLKDLADTSANVNRGMYNLICSKRDLHMYAKVGMKPHRHWKITDVKRYFGLKGNADKIYNDLLNIYDALNREVKNR